MKPTQLGWILLAAAACGGTNPQSLALDQPLWLSVDGAAGGVARVHLDGATAIATPPGPVIFRASDASAGATNDLSFTPTTLALELRRGSGRASVAALDFPLGDLRVFAPSLPAAGLQLRQLVLRLPETAYLEVVRADATTLTLAGTTPLSLDWKLQLDDGSLYPLGALPIGPVELHLAVSEDDQGALSLQLLAMCSASCGGVDQLFTLDDGMIWISGAATAH